jgi:SagB-type dehydrogenase family enzyme
LPKPTPAPADLWRTLGSRRSRRDYTGRPISLAGLSALLWAAQGITAPGWLVALRTAPSAGALYPVDLIVAARAVEGLPSGLWRLDAKAFTLGLTRDGEGLTEELTRACLGQEQVRRAAAILIFTATVERCSSKYGLRASRYVMLDAAHICQNVLLAAEALGLGACPVGAFEDSALNRLLGIDGEREAAIYCATVGAR